MNVEDYHKSKTYPHLATIDAFREVVRGLAAQDFEKAESTRTASCTYLDENGNRCAAGQLIPNVEDLTSDELGDGLVAIRTDLDENVKQYISEIRLTAAGKIVMNRFGSPDQSALGLMIALQRAHDLSNGIENMKHRLRLVAELFNLSISDLPELAPRPNK